MFQLGLSSLSLMNSLEGTSPFTTQEVVITEKLDGGNCAMYVGPNSQLYLVDQLNLDPPVPLPQSPWESVREISCGGGHAPVFWSHKAAGTAGAVHVGSG